MIEDSVKDYEELRQSMLKHVAIALEGHKMDTGYITSLDGLTATTAIVPDTGEEPMEIGSINKLSCWICSEE